MEHLLQQCHCRAWMMYPVKGAFWSLNSKYLMLTLDASQESDAWDDSYKDFSALSVFLLLV